MPDGTKKKPPFTRYDEYYIPPPPAPPAGGDGDAGVLGPTCVIYRAGDESDPIARELCEFRSAASHAAAAAVAGYEAAADLPARLAPDVAALFGAIAALPPEQRDDLLRATTAIRGSFVDRLMKSHIFLQEFHLPTAVESGAGGVTAAAREIDRRAPQAHEDRSRRRGRPPA